MLLVKNGNIPQEMALKINIGLSSYFNCCFRCSYMA